MSVFTASLTRELYRTFAGILIVLLAITTSVMAIRYLGQASSGRIDPRDVMIIMGFATLNVLSILLMLASFIGVLLVVIRNANEREFDVWNAAGVSLWQWLKPLAWLVLPCTLLSATLTFWLAPWANRQTDAYRESFQKRDDIARLSSGRFQESADGNRVFFVEENPLQPDQVNHVFVFSQSPQSPSQAIILADQGKLTTQANGNRMISLSAGRQHEGQIGQSDYQIMSFREYQIEVDAPLSKADKATLPDYSIPTAQLIAHFASNLSYQGELLNRLSTPLMALLLPLLALGLGVAQPRGGRSISLIFAMLIYLIYNNLALYLGAAVKQGSMSFGHTWWPLHAVFALGTVMFIAYKNNPSRWPLWRTRTGEPVVKGAR